GWANLYKHGTALGLEDRLATRRRHPPSTPTPARPAPLALRRAFSRGSSSAVGSISRARLSDRSHASHCRAAQLASASSRIFSAVVSRSGGALPTRGGGWTIR